MKTLIAIIVITLFAFGCAQAPVINPESIVVEEPELQDEMAAPTRCIPSKIGEHSYQSSIDPKVIATEWTEIKELRAGDLMLNKTYFRNPGVTSNVSVAFIIRQMGYVMGYYLLDCEEVKLFIRNEEIEPLCYEEVEIFKEYVQGIKTMLLKALGGMGI